MKALEQKVVFLGPKYTFSHEAALRMFPRSQYFYEIDPKKIFKKVEAGEMDYGIMPIENSATGLIFEFFPLLLDQDFQLFSTEVRVRVMKELYLPIYHHLLTRTQIPIGEIQTLYTNRNPYLQCIDWIQENLPGIKVEMTDSTATAAEKLAQDSKGACIGGNLLAKQERLVKVRENIQDYAKNITRFFAISAKHITVPKNANKTTFAVIIPDRIGTLVKALQFISSGGINLSNIKTMPVRAAHIFSEDFKDWFIIDIAVHFRTSAFQDLLEKFGENKDLILSHKILGSYYSIPIKRDKPGKGRGGKPETPTKPSPDRPTFYAEMVETGESESVEFKTSLRYDHKMKTLNKDLAKVVAKTLSGFMNSSGGYLLIGVSDTGEIVGIEEDINLLTKKTVDGFMSAFYQVVSDLIGKEFSQYVHPEVIDFKGKTVCCIKVDTSNRPAWLGDAGTFTLFIRVGNSTRPLNPREANDYIMSRFSAK